MKQFRKVAAAGLMVIGPAAAVLAQNETDALRYSQLQFGGTARVQGMAGAQTALGSDLSSLSLNPAGLGVYRRSELSFSPAITLGNSSSVFRGSAADDSKGNFNIPSFGGVFTNYRGDDYQGDWKSTSWGFSFTRLNHLHRRFTFSGQNPFNSLATYAEGRANMGISFNDLDLAQNTVQGLAFDAYILNPDPYTNQYRDQSEGIFLAVPQDFSTLQQTEEFLSTGAQNQWDFSYGANYRDRLYLGGGIGFTTLNYRQERTFTETDASLATAFERLTYFDKFRTSGGGLNLRIGAIYQAADWVRLGASVQTPTWYSLRDTYSSRFSSVFTADTVHYGPYNYTNPDGSVIQYPGFAQKVESTVALSEEGRFDYNLTTPFRANGGITLLGGKAGLLSADVEYVNYSSARLSATEGASNPFKPENQVIKSAYQSAVNLRVGVEGRFDIFRLRGGFARYGDPYENTAGLDRSRYFYTAGAGLQQPLRQLNDQSQPRVFFLDAAVVYSRYKALYQPYTLERLSPTVNQTVTSTNIILTAGLRF